MPASPSLHHFKSPTGTRQDEKSDDVAHCFTLISDFLPTTGHAHGCRHTRPLPFKNYLPRRTWPMQPLFLLAIEAPLSSDAGSPVARSLQVTYIA